MVSPARSGTFSVAFALVMILRLAGTAAPQETDLEILEPSRLEQISWRNIGPSNMGSQNGNIVRFDTRTGQSQRISPYPGGIVSGAPASEHEFRFDWNTPKSF